MPTPLPDQAPAAWRLLGFPRAGGTVPSLALSPHFTHDRTVCAGSTLAIHLSRDGGETWRTAPGSHLALPITGIAFSPDFARDRTIFAAMLHVGLWRSSNGGESWDFLTEGTSKAIAVSPDFARDGILLFATDHGILRSQDGGRSWQWANRGLTDRTAQAVAFSPAFAEDKVAFALVADALYRSSDGGYTWQPIGGEGLTGHALAAVALSPTFACDQTVFVGAEEAGLFRSTDRGATWQAVGPTALTDINCLAFADHRTLFAATAGGSIWRSADGGDTWQEVAQGLPSVLALAGSQETLFAGTYGEGVFRSTDGGLSWSPVNEGFAARGFLSLALSPAVATDGLLFIAGPKEGVYRSRDDGRTWEPLGLAEAEITGLAASPAFARDRTLLAAGQGGLFRSRDAGDSWSPLTLNGPVQRIAFSPALPDGLQILASSGPALYLSTDGGDTWDILRVPWGTDEVAAIAFSPNFARDGALLAVTGAPGGKFGYETAAIWRSFDGGRSWQRAVRQGVSARWLTMALPPDYDATISPHRAYIGWGNQVLRPFLTGPKHWTAGMLGPTHLRVLSLALSPAFPRDRTVYAATTEGIYRSTNEGLTWHPWSEGLGQVPAIVVAASGQRVYALAFGGTVWCREG